MFKPHGEWFYKISPPCVFIEFRGCVNKEAFVDFTNKIADEITGNSIKNLHHLIINVKQFELATAESVHIAKAYFETVKSRGYKQVDYVAPNSVAQSLIESVWKDSGLRVTFHKDINSFLEINPQCEKMRAWLESAT
ncbi:MULTISPECIES: hypothetical protein [unclassified Pseudoalteromonas]|uniref:hypothetical protein n=1 Tax=unclassified Pseudoalteromonas TaxID=194690 RepID=UPI00188283C2|nr:MULTISPECIES: hypothetical protein [Gammaproteobacteria]MCF7501805.1 hypothetical protein [Pseudoalteromonas sp. L1]MCF7520022.1 hypothetical protein [Pseudoalteromonas sp. L21]